MFFKLKTYNSDYYKMWQKVSEGRYHDKIPSFKVNKSFIALKKGERLFDAGCGIGHLLDYYTDLTESAFGVDVSMWPLKKAKESYPRFKLSVQNLTQIAFKDDMFDKISCYNVIEHIEGQNRVMEEFLRILKPGGVLVIGTIITDSFSWRLYQKIIGEHTHVKEFRKNEFVDYVRQFFDIVDYKVSSGFFRFGPPISWIFHKLLKSDIIVKARKP